MTETVGRVRGIVTAVLALLLLAPGAEARDAGNTAGLYFCKYEPNYLLLGVAEQGEDEPTTKFQFSFRYVLWDFRGPEVAEGEERSPEPSRCVYPTSRHQLNFGYSQKAIWRLYENSAPFEENNYNPEIYYAYRVDWGPLDWLSMGIEHESNGEGGDESRGWDRLYWQARLSWRFASGPGESEADPNLEAWQLRLYAKVWAILPGAEDDFTDYSRAQGHFKLVGVVATPDYGWGSSEVDVELGAGDRFDRGQVQIGAAYRPPESRIWRFVPYFYAQYFVGYGETLIRNEQFTQALRIGLRLLR